MLVPLRFAWHCCCVQHVTYNMIWMRSVKCTLPDGKKKSAHNTGQLNPKCPWSEQGISTMIHCINKLKSTLRQARRVFDLSWMHKTIKKHKCSRAIPSLTLFSFQPHFYSHASSARQHVILDHWYISCDGPYHLPTVWNHTLSSTHIQATLSPMVTPHIW